MRDMTYDDEALAEEAALEAMGKNDTISREVHRAAIEAETADLRDKLLRAVADTENMRKRMEREVAQARKYAVSAFVKDIIPLTDTFQRAIEAVPEDAAAKDAALKSLLDGVIMTERQFLNALERHGVKRIEPKGEIFDPNFHQAIAQFPNPDVPDGTVMEVSQPGFVLDGRIMRPAMVVVAQGGPKPVKATEAPADNNNADSDSADSENWQDAEGSSQDSDTSAGPHHGES